MKKIFFGFGVIMVLLVGCNLPVQVSLAVVDTPTPTVTFTPQPSPTNTPTPTLSPTPTPPPIVQIEHAEQSMFLGDYENARREFQSAVMPETDPALQAAALLGKGRALYAQNNFPAAIQALEEMLVLFPQDEQISTAYYYLGRAYTAQQNDAKAAEAYAQFLETGPSSIQDFIYDLRGDALSRAGDFTGAAEAYIAAIQTAPTGQNTLWRQMKLAQVYTNQGDFTNAVTNYLQIYEKTDNLYIRAQVNFLMGQIYLTLGQPEQANARFTDSVLNYPQAYDSYSGLVHLVNTGVPVDELARGIVNYYAGQYGLSVQAITRYIDSSPKPDSGAPYYFRALSRRALNEPEQAITDLDIVIEQYQGDRYWASAWEEKANIQWIVLNDHTAAAKTLMDFAQQAPDSTQAPGFMYSAARILERGDLLTQAAETWEQLIDAYPAYELSYRGLFLAGVSYYRLADYDKARLVFQRCLVLSTQPDEGAAALLWIGKTHQVQGNTEEMRLSWEQAAQRDPTGYYSERANELLANRPPFGLTRSIDLGYDLNQERPEAEAWLRSTFALPSELDLNGLADLASHLRVQRGLAFWRLDLYNEGRTEFELARTEFITDPVATYRLMNTFYSLGLYRSALLASRNILDLANLDDAGTLNAPAYFNHIRFGVYFKDLVLSAAQAESLNPLLLLSVIRQESLFEGFAISVAGARGLMQIMPATGQEIATGMNWPPDYQDADLYRPAINIPMGARYLARQRNYFNDDLFAALAAYNGGPGNTIAWTKLANGDPDLLLEVIRADETRRYIRQIYEFFNLYRIIYERG